ncbi:hypothetical protein DWU98_01810 [Dyella monticola]|uniref:Uncharacterized protein n=2 Tax=Dyella monticola TaxID=1927958 RepID=A0A370X8I0_9GAMM|nr:hypothetical protein DWU98_01810 [Dyella monticola]
MGLLCLTTLVDAASVHSFTLVNDTRTRVVSFSVALAGSSNWTTIDFHDPLFEYGDAKLVEVQGNGDDCLYDLRTTLSDGRNVRVRKFDACHRHVYRPGPAFP